MFLVALLCILDVIAGLQGHLVVEKILGSVEAGQFVYYSLNKPGRVVITLIPKEGDPDLYIGEDGTEPDYSLQNHSYQSTSCGIERIVVPRHAVRPIGIGVYGHPSYEQSIYELQVKIDEDVEDDELGSDLQLTEEDMRTDFVETESLKRSNEFLDSPLYNFISTLMSFIIEILL